MFQLGTFWGNKSFDLTYRSFKFERIESILLKFFKKLLLVALCRSFQFRFWLQRAVNRSLGTCFHQLHFLYIIPTNKNWFLSSATTTKNTKMHITFKTVVNMQNIQYLLNYPRKELSQSIQYVDIKKAVFIRCNMLVGSFHIMHHLQT